MFNENTDEETLDSIELDLTAHKFTEIIASHFAGSAVKADGPLYPCSLAYCPRPMARCV